jgi:hypothetical protein
VLTATKDLGTWYVLGIANHHEWAEEDLGGLTTIDAVYLALLLLAPGYILCAVRNLFLTGREVQGNEQLVKYLACSAINYLICSPLIYGVLNTSPSPLARGSLLIGTGLIVPAVLGVISGVAAQRGISRWILSYFGLHPVHAAPTAWDFVFAKPQTQMMKITLKNGAEFLGYWSSDSFASSDTKERDLLLKPLYEHSDEEGWQLTDRGLLVTAGEIRTVEFWSPKQEDYDEREEATSAEEQRLPAPALAAQGADGRTGRLSTANEPVSAAKPEIAATEKVTPAV